MCYSPGVLEGPTSAEPSPDDTPPRPADNRPGVEAGVEVGGEVGGEAAPAPDEPHMASDESLVAGASPVPAVHPRNRIASLVEVLVCSGFPTQIGVTLLLAALGVPAMTRSGTLSLAYLVWLSLIDTALIVALCVLFLRARAERPARIFLGDRAVGREVMTGLALLPVVFVLLVTAAGLIQWLAPGLRATTNPFEDLLRHPFDAAVFALVAIVAGGLREEVQQ